MNNPKIAIVMATYNPNSEFFIKQINSIKEQTYTNWQCIIIDDCSSPDKFKEIQNLLKDDLRFKIYQNNYNLGCYHTFEQGLYKISFDTQLIAFADQDDIWLPEKLEYLVNEFNNNPQVFLMHSDLALINENDELIDESCWKYEKRSTHIYNAQLLILRNIVTGCSMMFRREILKAALPFPEMPYKSFLYHDLWISLISLKYGQIKPINKALILYRQHSNNTIGAFQSKSFSIVQKIHKKFKEKQLSQFLNSLSNLKQRNHLASLYFANNKTRFLFFNKIPDFGLSILILFFFCLFSNYNTYILLPVLFIAKFVWSIKYLKVNLHLLFSRNRPFRLSEH